MEESIMTDIKKQVESILRGYTAMQKELQVLGFELGRITPPLRSEVIEAEMLSHPGYESVPGSRISDKTANIVVEHIDGQRNSEYHALTALIHNMRFELNRLEYYLTLLPEDEATVIKLFYFDGLEWADILKKSPFSLSTIKRRRRSGLNKLVYYYSILDRLDPENLDIRTRARFISYIHEERFADCLNLAGNNRTAGIDAMLYILSGCNELWQAGVETFFSFEDATTIDYTESKSSISDNGRKLLRLAYHFANGLEGDDLVHVLRYYFSGLEYVHLELAIEAVKLALFPGAMTRN